MQNVLLLISMFFISITVQLDAFYNNYSDIDYTKSPNNIILQLELHSLDNIFFPRQIKAALTPTFESLCKEAKNIIDTKIQRHTQMLQNEKIQQRIIDRCKNNSQDTALLYKKAYDSSNNMLNDCMYAYVTLVEDILLKAIVRIVVDYDIALTEPLIIEAMQTDAKHHPEDAQATLEDFRNYLEKNAYKLSSVQQENLVVRIAILEKQLNITNSQPHTFVPQFLNDYNPDDASIRADTNDNADLSTQSDIKAVLAKPQLSKAETICLQKTLDNMQEDKTPYCKKKTRYTFDAIPLTPTKNNSFSSLFTQFLDNFDTLSSSAQLMSVMGISLGIYSLYKITQQVAIWRKNMQAKHTSTIQKKKTF